MPRHRAPAATLALMAAALSACGTESEPASTGTSSASASPTATVAAISPTLVAYAAPCEPVGEFDSGCESEAAEFAGTVQVVNGCVLIDEYVVGPTKPRSLIVVLFPHGVSWSADDNGVVTSDGDLAHPGEWIYGGGGSSPLADLELLELTDEQQSDIKRCAATSDATEVFFEMGANDSIERIDGPPDY